MLMICLLLLLPMHARAAGAEVLLARDSSGVLYGSGGRPSKRRNSSSSGGNSNGSKAKDGGSVALAAPPLALAVSGPYAVALAEAGGEARLLEPLTHAEGELQA